MGGEDHVRVNCRECGFSRVIGPDEGILPADILIEHGQETGHTLTIETDIQDTD